MNINQVLQDALARHQAGELEIAENLYRKILKKKPKQTDAHNLLGVLLQQKGDLEGAIKHTKRATQLNPEFHVPYVNLGNALQAANEIEAAADAFRKADQLKPGQPETLNNLASVFNDMGAYQDALNAANRAMKINPNMGEVFNNEGNAFLGLGRPEDALTSFERAQALGAPVMDVFFNIARAKLVLGEFAVARQIYEKLIGANPTDARLWFGLGNADQAVDDFDKAIEGFLKAIDLDPKHTAARCNLAAAHQAKGDTDAAITVLEQALIEEPDAADLKWNLALAHLQAGNYADGWRKYAARWDIPAFQGLRKSWQKSNWQGEGVSGKTVLIRAEQGFGDALQFCRYAPLLAGRGAKVIIECRPQLTRLLAGLKGIEDAIDLDIDGTGAPLPEHDLQVPLMDLPHLFETTLDNLPTDTPYLSPPQDAEVDPQIASASGLKVGVAWEGSATRGDNHKRSLALDQFDDLFATDGVQFFSMQVGPGQAALADRNSASPASTVFDLAEGLTDFAATAAALDVLDLIITVDTAVFHLAGALGKPVWCLLSRPAGYLYGTDGDTHPWYPTAKLYRQPTPGDWTTVFATVHNDLRKFRNDQQ